MSIGENVAANLPYLRRYARALTGSQQTGDAFVRATLEAALADADPPPRWVRVEGAGHFFHGQLAIIKSTTVEFLEGLAI